MSSLPDYFTAGVEYFANIFATCRIIVIRSQKRKIVPCDVTDKVASAPSMIG